MFAPPIKAPQAKTASLTTPTRAPKPPQRTPLRPGTGLSNRAMLRLLRYESQEAESFTGSTSVDHQRQEADRGRMARAEAASSASWDFSKVPLFPPDRLSQHQTPSPLVQRKLAIGQVND